MTTLPITLTAAAAVALLNLWLAIRVSTIRVRGKVMIGDGGNPLLEARMRAHANFIEYAPIFLILLGLIELSQGSLTWLWYAMLGFVLARIIHAFGMDRRTANALRGAGIILTWALVLALAAYALAIPYLAQGDGMTVLG